VQEKLLADYDCEVTDPFNLGLDRWGTGVEVRREKFKDRKTNKRVALIYWTNDEQRELIINDFVDEGIKYKWNGVPARKNWSEYKSDSAL
jgi:hypothetical protein